MIEYDNGAFLRVLFRVDGTVYRAILLRCIIVSLVGVLAGYLEYAGYIDEDGSYVHSSAFQTFYPFVGTVLGLILSFRVSIAYSRWEEATVQMGALRRASRGLISCVAAYCACPPEQSDKFAKLLIRLRRQLVTSCVIIVANINDRVDLEDLVGLGYLPREDYERLNMESHIGFSTLHEENQAECQPARVRPALMLTHIRETIAEFSRSSFLGVANINIFDDKIADLSNAYGSILRIAANPMPFNYAHFLKLVLTIYVCSVPFGIAPALKWLTPLFTFMVAFLFFGVEAIAIELEEPLGNDANDVDPTFHLVRVDIETAAVASERLRTLNYPEREQPSLASHWRQLDLLPPDKRATPSLRGERLASSTTPLLARRLSMSGSSASLNSSLA